MIRAILLTTCIGVLSTGVKADPPPPSTRFEPPASSSNSSPVPLDSATSATNSQPKARRAGFSTYSDSAFDSTGFSSGYGSAASDSVNSASLVSHSGYAGPSSGYSGAAGYSSSGFAPAASYSPSPSHVGGYSSSGSSGYSSGGYSSSSAIRAQSRPTKQTPPPPSYAPPSYSQGSAYGTPLSHNEIAEQGGDSADPVKYEFTYEVLSPESGSEFGHRESRTGGVTQGQYHVLLPDGRIQTVDYLADQGGYRPTVSYQQTDRVFATSASATQSAGYTRGGYPSSGSTTGRIPSSGSSFGGYPSQAIPHGTPIVRQAPSHNAGAGSGSGSGSGSYSIPSHRQSQQGYHSAGGDYRSKASERVQAENVAQPIFIEPEY